MSAEGARARAYLQSAGGERVLLCALCWLAAIAYGLLLPASGEGGIPCLWQLLFGVHCPGCGLTHAWALLLRGDVAAAAHANWLVFPVVAGLMHHSWVFVSRARARVPAHQLTVF